MEEKTAPERVRSGAAFSAEEGGGEFQRFFFTSEGKRAKIPPTGFQTRSKRGRGRVRSAGLTAVL